MPRSDEYALRFRFRWRANGVDHETVIEAPDYALACYRLGRDQGMTFSNGVPADFQMNLSEPERVE